MMTFFTNPSKQQFLNQWQTHTFSQFMFMRVCIQKLFVCLSAVLGASAYFHDTELSTSFLAAQKPAFSIIRRVKWVHCFKPHSTVGLVSKFLPFHASSDFPRQVRSTATGSHFCLPHFLQRFRPLPQMTRAPHASNDTTQLLQKRGNELISAKTINKRFHFVLTTSAVSFKRCK